MRVKLFNSLARKKQNFAVHGNKVGMYVCGITPDAKAHIGHAFVFTSFDVLVRYLRHLGHKVRYVQNLTDIDDDIIRRSKAQKKNWKTFGKEHAREFLLEMRWLNNVDPDVYPKATEHIQEMIVLIKKLLKKGVAYVKNGCVYFEVAKDRDYGKLSLLSRRMMLKIANERGNYPDDPNKKNPLDFVLWQVKMPGEPAWSSPWGDGRPGWHIECSAMAMKYLGETIDIQGGGSDLLFPHHESSIAQSETATQKQYARFWLHVGMVRCDGEKMSKSLGNVVLVEDMQKKYSANTLRIFLLSHHYRSVWEFHEKDIVKAQKINDLFQDVWKVKSKTIKALNVSLWEKKFYSAMSDDLGTKKALVVLQSLAREIVKKSQKKSITKAQVFFTTAFNILGLTIQ
ncbi:MAG: cysteine--tRNA ligase [bacterium]|nr:cysteine--tRNA ligase [bacterium]